jgi:hypothetical protein
MLAVMPSWMLTHQHAPHECRVVFAAWRGFDSPLRRLPTLASCEEGGHSVWWTVEAGTAEDAIAQLPEFVAERTEISRVSEVEIP